MLENALVLDGQGQRISHPGKIQSSDWDEVQEFCRKVYMPYRVQPLQPSSKPNATMLSTTAGRVTFSRFCYGTAIHLDQFEQQAGKILVLNTVKGALQHKSNRISANTACGESFVVDCSRTNYSLVGDQHHLQLNLTIDHDVMEEVAERWFGFVPDSQLWTTGAKLNTNDTTWLQLLDYSLRTLSTARLAGTPDKLGQHLEELICVELLRQWSSAAQIDLSKGASAASPYYVRQAEEIFSAEARDMPSVTDVAQRVGVSARTLSEGFRCFRGITPRTFLASQRLDGLRKDLLAAPDHLTVACIASDWGYVNFGNMARNYKQRFGELPSQTRKRNRHRKPRP